MDEWTREKKKKQKEKPGGKRGKPLVIQHRGGGLVALLVFGIMGLIVGVPLLVAAVFLTEWNRVGALVAGLGLSLVGGGLLGAYFFFRGGKTRLVFDAEGMALESGDSGVVGFVPYSNVAAAEVARRFNRVTTDILTGETETGEEWSVLAITLLKHSCPDTFWPVMQGEGRSDIDVKDEYTRDLSFIRARLLEKVREYRDRKGYKSLG